MSDDLHLDVLIFGGGIAGLWTLHALHRQGYSAALLESGTIGGGQTIAAQGVLHAGLKYALQGVLTDSSENLRELPDRWKACLVGAGEIDLGPVRVLSESQYLWALPGAGGRLKLGSLSKLAASRMEKAGARPDALSGYDGALYQLDEWVVDVPSLLHALADPLMDRLVQVDWARDEIVAAPGGGIDSVRVQGRTLRADRYVLAAGAGNEELLARTGGGMAMQRRPLHQVMVTGAGLPPCYSVCLGSGTKPAFVCTSHPAGEAWVWYLGGELAESGVERSEAEQVEHARARLAEWMPWIDFDGAAWSTLRIDRAEAARGANQPINLYCEAKDNRVVVWPTKLVLAPRAADRVLALLDAPARDAGALGFESPVIADPVWSRS